MVARYCKCGNEMSVIKKEFAWYWCGKCGRFLNGGQLLDPGDEWFEPLSSDTVLADVLAEIDGRCTEVYGGAMGEEVNIEKIECYRDAYQIDIRYEDSGKGDRIFIRKDALFALLCIAEKENIDKKNYEV